MLKECFDLLDDLATDADRRCPDQFGMYVQNDFYGYGMMEVLENMLRAFENEIKPLSGKKASLQQMWAIVTVLAMFLCRDVSFPWSMVDDGERYEHLIAVSGCAALTALNELDRVGQLKKDSRFLDLGHVMAMFLLWSKTATGLTVEGRIRHDPYDDDDAELEIYEWVGPLLAYAAKADIDLAEQRVSGIDKVLKRTTVGGLRGSAKADKWDWTATFRDYQNRRIGRQVVLSLSRPNVKLHNYNLLTWIREARARYAFDDVDPLAEFSDEQIAAGDGARVDSEVPIYELSIREIWKDWTWSTNYPNYQELQAYFDHADKVLKTVPLKQSSQEPNLTRMKANGTLRRPMVAYLYDHKANRAAYDFWAKKQCARITDPRKRDLLAPLEPPHPFGVKRPCLEQNYYEQFNRPNVDVVDISEKTTDGEHYEFDVMAIATGFDITTGGMTNMGLKSVKGTYLKDEWKRAAYTYLGTTVSGYPNMFHLYGPHGPTLLSNGPTSVEVQGRWIRDAINNITQQDLKYIDATEEASKEWKKRINALADASLFPTTKSTYMGGSLPGKAFEQVNYAGGLSRYKEEIRAALPGWQGFRVVKNDVPQQAAAAA
ncbi:hypothetical protein TI39_contig4110g00008 [Zymoseptoria brevis]|uniref:Uncharacterized protein n=1 Tax=Zymoseptoria brevis TaxID=1047168 RepID=A0A0F4GH23_9PEZI|nr:hypothetical protein TI39_contig4110g00008 [Zymoseptoria brevis]